MEAKNKSPNTVAMETDFENRASSRSYFFAKLSEKVLLVKIGSVLFVKSPAKKSSNQEEEIHVYVYRFWEESYQGPGVVAK